jgi:proteasome accessory factor B
MIDAAERLMNLALYLASSQGTVTAEQVRAEVSGYPEDQDDVAFKRMLERDKDVLRSSGFAIDSDDEGNYRLNRSATYIGELTLSDEEAAAVTAVATALAHDPSFPFAADLRLALTKISAQIAESRPDASAVLADEEPALQGETVGRLAEAAGACKRIAFDYTNASGVTAPHEVDPYGLFLHAGRWYLVGRDTSKDEPRTYAVTRIGDVTVNASAPKTPDFARPEGFDVASFLRLPFQYGKPEDEFEATLRFDPEQAAKAARLAPTDEIFSADDGAVVWKTRARSARALARFAIENGPGLRVESPAAVVDEMSAGLAEVGALHG